MALKEYRKTKFYGGLSDSEVVLTDSTFAGGYNLDIFSRPGLIRPSAKLVESTNAPNIRFYKAIYASDDYQYWVGTGGKIYKYNGVNTWTNVYTDTGADVITSICEFDGYLYWTTLTKLHRKPFPGLSNWTDTVEDWATFTQSRYERPMVVQGSYLVIGNGTTLATVDDSGVFTDSGTADITLIGAKEQTVITSLISFGEDVLAGAQYQETASGIAAYSGYLLRWDLVSGAFNSITPVNDNGVYALANYGNMAIVFAGEKGNIYGYDGSNVYKIKKVPTIIGNNPDEEDSMIVKSYSVANFKGNVVFGTHPFQATADYLYVGGNDFRSMVYELGNVKEGYPLALSPAYSADNDTAGGNYGVLVASSKNLYFQVQLVDAGVNKVYYTSTDYVATNCGVSLVITGEIEKNKTFLEYAVGCLSPTATLATARLPYLYAYPNIKETSGGSVVVHNIVPDVFDKYKKFVSQYKIDARTLHLKSIFFPTVATDNQEAIDSIYVKWNEEEKL